MNRRTFIGTAAVGGVGAAAGLAVGLDRGEVLDATTRRSLARLAARTEEYDDNAGPLVPLDAGTQITVWSVPVHATVATLTFDDGPDPQFTPRVLEALDHAGVKATFNMMGWNVAHHVDLAHEVVEAGHEIGNHTYHHLDLAHLDGPTAWAEIRGGRDELAKLGLDHIRWFRPPRGEITGRSARFAAQLGHDLLMWSVLGGERGAETPDEVVSHVVGELAPGRIVALHDGIGRGTFNRRLPFAELLVQRREAEVRALPRILDRAADQGVRFVTASELLGYDASVISSASRSGSSP